MGRKLYVGNLSYNVGETELQELFSSIGAVENVTVMRDHATGQARGFAFVEMSSEEDAQRATTELKAATAKKGRELFHPLRLALTGRESGPEMAGLVQRMGKERAIRRLENAAKR